MARLSIRVQAGASRSEIVGFEGDVLRLRVTTPPVEGQANEAVIELLARTLGMPMNALVLERGRRGRQKVIDVDGLSEAQVRERLGAPRRAP